MQKQVTVGKLNRMHFRSEFIRTYGSAYLKWMDQLHRESQQIQADDEAFKLDIQKLSGKGELRFTPLR